jgi:DHA2 family multidrug resistance protein
VFLINVPIGILSLFLVNMFVDEPDTIKNDRKKLLKRGIRIDYIGVLLVALGLGFLEVTLDRGEREDWFASGFIVTTAVLAGISLIGLVLWETHTDEPVVDLKLLRNRNFSATLLVMGLTGMILFSTTQLIPQMLQQVIGYTSFDAGLALTAGGFMTLVMVPIAGRLSGVVDVRMLLFPAILGQAFALWNMSHLTADVSFFDAALARLYQSMFLPFLFVPLSAVAYAGLPQNKTAQASSLLNVARNLGGTIGISSSQSMLSTAMQRHQTELVQGLNPLNFNYSEWLAKAQNAVGSVGDTTTPLALLYSQVQRQASMLAFLDVFRSLMIIVLIVSPAVFLMKPSKSGGGGGGMAH